MRQNRLHRPILTLILLAVLGLPLTSTAQEYDKSVPTPTHSGVKYGEHERHVLDAWLVQADEPTPLVFIIHGGGWRAGSKERAQRFADVKALLDAGISVVAINYRLISNKQSSINTDTIDLDSQPPVHTPLHDAARALQFVRSKAKQWSIDPNRIGAAGGSAGACSSLWLAFHDDLADPDSDDPIARQSTRLQCAAVIGAQTTLDPVQMKAWTPNSRYGGHAFGLGSFDNFLAQRDTILPWIEQYSPYHNVSEDDPPIYLLYNKQPNIGKVEKDPTHTANFGLKLQEYCQGNGVACELYYPGKADAKHESTTDFLIATLNAE